MSIQEIINLLGETPQLILYYFVSLIVISLIGLLLINENNFNSPVKYIYGILVYAITIPGLLAFILLLYNIFFLKANLLLIDFTTYFLPIIAMIIVLTIINKTVEMSKIPWFNKLSGMFIIVLITFFITYLLQKMFFGVFFIGSISSLMGLFLFLLIILKFAWSKIVN